MKYLVLLGFLCLIILYYVTRKADNNDKKLLFVSLFTLIFSGPTVWITISSTSPIGFIRIEHTEAWIGFYGGIFVGIVGFIGVWWSIQEQKISLLNQQKEIENQRKEDLAIQYKPFLILNDNIDEMYFTNTNIQHNMTAAELCAKTGNERFTGTFFISLTNIGSGECLLLCDDDAYFENSDVVIIEPDESSCDGAKPILKKGYNTVIGRQQTIHFKVILKFSGNISNVKMIIPLKYEDQFSLKKYDATVTLIFNIKSAKNIELITYSVKNQEIITEK